MNSPFGLMLTRTLQLTILAAVMGCAASLVSVGTEERSKRVGAGKTIKFVADTTYTAECTSCHVGFLPGFLPMRSWNKIMGDLENHFGENASLEDPALSNIKAYLVNSKCQVQKNRKNDRLERHSNKNYRDTVLDQKTSRDQEICLEATKNPK